MKKVTRPSQAAFPGINCEQDLLTKIKWLTTIRVMVVTLILGSIAILQFKETSVSLFPFYNLIIVTYLMTIPYVMIIRLGPPDTVFFAYTQICGDIIIETALVFYTGGIGSPFSFTYIITIITASILLSRRSSLLTASAGSLLYSLLMVLQLAGVINPPRSYMPKGIGLNLSYASHTIFANIFAFYLVAFLSGHLAELQRKAGKKLQVSEGNIAKLQNLNENILQSMSSGLIVTDPDGKVILMNRAASQILDLNPPGHYPEHYPEHYPGHYPEQRHWNNLFKPLKIEEFSRPMAREGKNFRRLESWISRDGQEIPLGMTISMLKNTQGEAQGLITNFQDLTDFKNMEEQVKQAEVLATIGQMSASIAHELRNPMASIRGCVQFLYDELQLENEHRRLMEIILKESNRLNTIITDFLTYAKPQHPTLQKCSIQDLVQETVTLIRTSREWSERLRIITHLPSSLPPIDIDPGQIKQVFWNLTINACQAMPDGGILHIRGKQTGSRPPTPGNFLLMEFADTGSGIRLDEVKKLFNPFYTTKERGMGLGLSIAYRIIEAHGGKIEVISAPDEGSNFRIYLPCKPHILLETRL